MRIFLFILLLFPALLFAESYEPNIPYIMRTAPAVQYDWEEAVFFIIKKNGKYERKLIFYMIDAGGRLVPAYQKRLEDNDPVYRQPQVCSVNGGFRIVWLDPFATSWIKTKDRQLGNGAFGYTEETGAWRYINVKKIHYVNLDISDIVVYEGTPKQERYVYTIRWPSAPFWFPTPVLEEEIREKVLAENSPQVPL